MFMCEFSRQQLNINIAAEQQMKRSSILGEPEECAICANAYDRDRRLPTLVCGNRHTVCGECLEDISRKASSCPFCREPIRLPSTALNLDIFTRLPERGRAEVSSRQSSYAPANFRFNGRQREEAPAFQGANRRAIFGHPIQQGQLDEYIRPPEVENDSGPAEEWTDKNIVLIGLFSLFVVAFNIAVALISLNLASSSSQCSNAKTNSQGSISFFFRTMEILTMVSLVQFLCLMIYLCGQTMNAGSTRIFLCYTVLVDAIWKGGLFLLLLVVTGVIASLGYCPRSFSVFTFVLFAGLGVQFFVSWFWMK